MSFLDSLFGSTDDSAQESQEDFNNRIFDFSRKMARDAKGDSLALFDAGMTNRNRSFNSALNLYGKTIPRQMQAFKEGNVSAQKMLLSGLPQMQNALMGLPTDLSGLNPTRIKSDLSWTKKKLPETRSGIKAVRDLNKARPKFTTDKEG